MPTHHFSWEWGTNNNAGWLSPAQPERAPALDRNAVRLSDWIAAGAYREWGFYVKKAGVFLS